MAQDLIPPSHIGDGLYFTDNEYEVQIAINHHNNTVAVLDMNDIQSAIDYLTKVKERIEKRNKKFYTKKPVNLFNKFK